MKLTDILLLKKWGELEKAINSRFGLNACVFDKDGIRITDFKKWVNSLCPIIKANPRGQRYICAVAHQNIAGEAAKSGNAIIGECDAGLVKVAVPIFVGDEFLGVAGGCGRRINDSEVEYFLISKVTGINQEQVIQFSEDISRMAAGDLHKTVEFIKERVDEILTEFGKEPKQDVVGMPTVVHLSSLG